jgi:hypothetical protein
MSAERVTHRDSARVALLRLVLASQQRLLDRDRKRGWTTLENIRRVEARMEHIQRLIEDAERREL